MRLARRARASVANSTCLTHVLAELFATSRVAAISLIDRPCVRRCRAAACSIVFKIENVATGSDGKAPGGGRTRDRTLEGSCVSATPRAPVQTGYRHGDQAGHPGRVARAARHAPERVV